MLKTLLGIRLRSFFAASMRGKDGKISRGKIVGMSILMLVLVLCFASISLSIGASMAMILIPAGLDAPFFAIFNLITMSVVFIFSIFETKSELFDCRDNELLLSMPMRPGDIVISRIMSVLLLNVGETLIVMVPALIMYVVFGGSPIYVVTSLITSLLICLLATALASAVGYLVARLSALFKNNSFISVALYIIFFVLYFAGYQALMDGLLMLEEDPDAALGALETALAPISVLGEISILSPVPTVIFLIISIGVSVLAWYIISKNYIRIITNTRKTVAKKYKKEKLYSSSVLTALIKKETAYFFSSSTYILNGASGVLGCVILIVLAVSAKDVMMSELGAFELLGGKEFIYLALTALLSGIAFMNMISASALSLEGKRYWIIKSSPIPARAIIYSKLAPHLIVCVPPSLVASIVLAIVVEAPALWWLPIILVPQIANLASAVFGLVLNIAFPKFEFANDAQVIKQSLPSFICTMLGMLLLVVSVFIAIFLAHALSALVGAIVIALFYLVVFLILFLILTGPSERRLAKL